MISIVICSANSVLLENTISNIRTTIGVPYEVISFENSDGKMGICEVYNKGAKKANYEIICFMHEDLEIKTADWGIIVADIFKSNRKIGLIGVAGGAYKSLVPSGWGAGKDMFNTISCNYLQSFKKTKKESVHCYANPDDVNLAKVICVDGMWFCTLKEIVNKYPFDEKMLKGFHCYDIDYSLSIQEDYEAVVTYKILLEHFSEGGYDRNWLKDTLKLHSKWSKKLPLSLKEADQHISDTLEKRAFQWLLERMIIMDYSIFTLISFLKQQRDSGVLTRKLYFKSLYYACKYYIFQSKFRNA
ncbi:glycosyltransferase [Pedobacter sp. AW31-3R]|uniref:glycosyltransferase n=1 Tax=Pedobacter sp. AW31-3R TaxID=3445781 RepID=UPI003F9F1ADC